MPATNEITRLVTDLAARWTEPALRMLKASGMAQISVDMEIKTWRTLRAVLKSEIRRRSLEYSTLASIRLPMGSMLYKATRRVRERLGGNGSPRETHRGTVSRLPVALIPA